VIDVRLGLHFLLSYWQLPMACLGMEFSQNNFFNWLSLGISSFNGDTVSWESPPDMAFMQPYLIGSHQLLLQVTS
jgi:hypothetical protein